jgi:uncharacterized membrane protein
MAPSQLNKNHHDYEGSDCLFTKNGAKLLPLSLSLFLSLIVAQVTLHHIAFQIIAIMSMQTFWFGGIVVQNWRSTPRVCLQAQSLHLVVWTLG